MSVWARFAPFLAAAVVLATTAVTEALTDPGRPPREVVAALSGYTYQLRPGDTIRVPSPAAHWRSPSSILVPVPSQAPTSAAFRATTPGIGMITTTVQCGQTDCSISYAVVVTRQRPYDLALSGIGGGTYVLRVGEQVLFGYLGVAVQSTSPDVLESEGLFASPGPGLSVFRALRPGQASLTFRGGWNCVDARACPGVHEPMGIKFIVSGSRTRFDRYASVRDAETTILMRKGQTLEIALAPEPGFNPWRWTPWAVPMVPGNIPDQQLLDTGALGEGGLTDPETTYFQTPDYFVMPDRAGFLVKTVGTARIGFKARPLNCRPWGDCPELDRLFALTIEVDS